MDSRRKRVEDHENQLQTLRVQDAEEYNMVKIKLETDVQVSSLTNRTDSFLFLIFFKTGLIPHSLNSKHFFKCTLVYGFLNVDDYCTIDSYGSG